MALILNKCCFIFLLGCLFTLSCSGTFVGFSYDAKRNSPWSVEETISFLMKSNASASQIRLLVSSKDALDSVSRTGVPVNLYMNSHEVNLWKSKSSATLWLNNHLVPFLPHINISSIIVSCNPPTSKNQLCLLHPTLNSIHLALKRFHLDHQIKVSITQSLTALENPNRNCKKCLSQAAELIRKLRSHVVIDTTVDGVSRLGEKITASLITKAESAMNQIADKDIPIVLNVRSSSVFPGASEVVEFREKLMESMKNKAQIKERIREILLEISPMEEYKQKELNREKQQISPSSHRELLNKNKATLETKTTVHDTVNPPLTTKPATTPFSVPPTNPTPLIVVTIPSAPNTFLPAVPGKTPFANPVTTTPNIPVSTPVTSNPANSAMPGTAVTVTNPVTTYTTPVATPIMVFAPPPPITTSPVVTGQSWCVAKMDAPEAALQAALDYACGIGGADCIGIQQAGSCYNPNTLRDHASYAFNSYYQKNPVPSSCDFGGIAATVGINPSSGTCIYPSSSYSSSSSSSILNTNYSTSSSAVFGSGPPTFTSDSAFTSVDFWLLLAVTSITTSFVIKKQLIGT